MPSDTAPPSWMDPDAIAYGIVNIAVANLRQLASFPSEMTDQAPLGTIVPIFEDQNEFCFITNWDGYPGWMTRYSMVRVDADAARAWSDAPDRLVCTDNHARVSGGDEVLTELVTGAVVRQVGVDDTHFHVTLPDGREGRVRRAALMPESALLQRRAMPETIVAQARQFLGIPYLWGGATSKAFDCSGLVQMVYRLWNHHLPRNASQMAHHGTDVPLDEDFTELRAGDLLFFGKSRRRITHVAIAIGDSRYLHAEGLVKINSLDPDADDYNLVRRDSLLLVRRVLTPRRDA